MERYDLNRTIKFLIIFNGVLIPLCVFYGLYKIIRENQSYNNYEPEDIVVGEELNQALKDSLALQGLQYDYLAKVYNSTNYFLFVAAKTYEEAREFKSMLKMSGDISVQEDNWLNIVFFDKNFRVIGNLLNQKATISKYLINQPYSYDRQEKLDTTAKHICYSIGFTDSNNDGRLNSQDDHDWYISDLNGKNLKQITSGVDVLDLTFVDSNKKILITYIERSNIRAEYKLNKFAVYDIKSQTLIKLTEVENQLKGIEETLTR